ncbi:M81 family metallopeptidase [Sinorhizobium meliloti]|uniref:M81 family metallopeptidase n=1 Tax=Rhizobium meliloti TaxID=382 RepID=UPI000FDA638D|nr:M81 family metallopeptidase [Sinorhizobium meliloti]RVK26438.1 M81 family peptidase [Sinorhizobium meliloti]
MNMNLRIAIGGISHETNTFCARDMELSDFSIERGHSIIDNHNGVRDFVGGMLDAAATLNATVVPTYLAVAEAGGAISETAYSRLVDDLLASITRSMPVDAVVLELHGAGIARGIGNIEVDICRRVRQLVGADVKLVINLDLHGNLNQELSRLIEVAFGNHDHPHTDMFERGQDAVDVLPRLLDGTIRPVTHIEKLPMLMITATTMHGPAAAIKELCRSVETDPDIITCTFFHGFPWADTPDTGPSVLVVANGSAEEAQNAAQRVARLVWDLRDEFRPRTLSPEEAIKSALKSVDWPIIVLDGADCAGAGCPADGTYLLRAMIDADLSQACFAPICDSAIVAQCHQAGVGALIEVRLGGKVDGMHGAPIEAKAYVKNLTDGRFVRQSPMGKGGQESVGRTARLQIRGVDIIVVSERFQPVDPELFLSSGIDVARYRIIGLKSLNHWRAGFKDVIKRDYLADSPGLMSQDLTRFSYNFVPRPAWPFDDEAIYLPG